MQMTQLYVAHMTLRRCSLLTLIILMLNYKRLVNGWKLTLSLNAIKSKYMIFHHPQKILRFQLEINDTHIECVDNFNFLGLTINKQLNWKNHIDKLACKISRSIAIIRKSKQFVLQHVLVNQYNSLVLPYINYCLLSWGIQQDRILKKSNQNSDL